MKYCNPIIANNSWHRRDQAVIFRDAVGDGIVAGKHSPDSDMYSTDKQTVKQQNTSQLHSIISRPGKSQRILKNEV